MMQIAAVVEDTYMIIIHSWHKSINNPLQEQQIVDGMVTGSSSLMLSELPMAVNFRVLWD